MKLPRPLVVAGGGKGKEGDDSMSEVHNLGEVFAAPYPQDTKDRLRAQYTPLTGVFRVEIAAAFAGTCTSKVADSYR